MKRTSRQLQHLKSTRVRVGEGHPTPNEGSTGDLSLRMTKTGLKLFAKFGNKWYVIGQGSLKQLSGDNQDVTLDENNRKATQLKTTKAGNLESFESLRMETKKGGGFNSFFDIDKDVRLESAGDTYINPTGENLYLGGSNYLKVFIQSAVMGYPQLHLVCNGGAAIGPIMYMKNLRSGNGVDGDDHGTIVFHGKNDAAEEITYGKLYSETYDKTDGSEKGVLRLQALTTGGLQSGLLIRGTSTSSEIDVTIGAGAASVLSIAGDIAMSGDDIVTAGALNFNIHGDLTLDTNTGIFHFQDAADSDDEFKITVVGGTGATTLETVSASGDGHLTLDSDGDLILDSGSGRFIAKNAGTEFSADNSAYAGMMLGYTDIHPSTADRWNISTSYVSQMTTGSGTAETRSPKITFTVPPSGKVEIGIFLPYLSNANGTLYAGLATDNSATSLGAQYEDIVWDVDETDTVQVTHRWTVEGLTAGDELTYWLMLKVGLNTARVAFGGDSAGNYGGLKMWATALPITIYDGT